jgi:DNA-binding ferritin-like protein
MERNAGAEAKAMPLNLGIGEKDRQEIAQGLSNEMIRLMVEGQEAVIRTARSVFPAVDRVNDEPTADLLTRRMQVHEKTAWMLRSLLAE